MKNPKVTVIIPAYNAEKYIEKCLDSVLVQSYQDFEILVINDGSSDGTGKILESYAKKYPEKIRYIEQKNMGVAKTRNKAVKMAKGEFIAFIDNDDFIDRDYLEKLLPRNGEDVVMSGYKRPDKKGKIVKLVRLEKNAVWSKFVVPAPWAKIYRRRFILENGLEFLDNNIGEDVYFNLIAMVLAKRVKVLNYVGYNWFYNDFSVSNGLQRKFKNVDVFKLLNNSYDQLKKRNLVEGNYEVLEFFFYRYIIWFLLYSVKRQERTDIDKIYDELFDWLSERFPNYKKNGMMRGKLSGETRATRVACEMFNLFDKINLGKSLVNIWSKV